MKRQLDVDRVERLMTEAEIRRSVADRRDAWRAIYAAGDRCRGPRHRSRDAPDARLPSPRKWTETFAASAREGGFWAAVLMDSQEPAAVALEQLETEGQEYNLGAPGSLARDDWRRAPAQLKRAARRRHSPDYSALAELRR